MEGLRIQFHYPSEIDGEVDKNSNSIAVDLVNVTGELDVYDMNQSSTPKVFAPLQFHFHAPSEHTFNSRNYDLELHIVHSYPDKSALSVIAVFFDQ